jgi:hypothetical protein
VSKKKANEIREFLGHQSRPPSGRSPVGLRQAFAVQLALGILGELRARRTLDEHLQHLAAKFPLLTLVLLGDVEAEIKEVLRL